MENARACRYDDVGKAEWVGIVREYYCLYSIKDVDYILKKAQGMCPEYTEAVIYFRIRVRSTWQLMSPAFIPKSSNNDFTSMQRKKLSSGDQWVLKRSLADHFYKGPYL